MNRCVRRGQSSKDLLLRSVLETSLFLAHLQYLWFLISRSLNDASHDATARPRGAMSIRHEPSHITEEPHAVALTLRPHPHPRKTCVTWVLPPRGAEGDSGRQTHNVDLRTSRTAKHCGPQGHTTPSGPREQLAQAVRPIARTVTAHCMSQSLK